MTWIQTKACCRQDHREALRGPGAIFSQFYNVMILNFYHCMSKAQWQTTSTYLERQLDNDYLNHWSLLKSAFRLRPLSTLSKILYSCLAFLFMARKTTCFLPPPPPHSLSNFMLRQLIEFFHNNFINLSYRIARDSIRRNHGSEYVVHSKFPNDFYFYLTRNSLVIFEGILFCLFWPTESFQIWHKLKKPLSMYVLKLQKLLDL